MKGLPVTINDRGGLTVAQIADVSRRAKRENKIGFIMLDHLHIVRATANDVRAGATLAVGQISQAMKAISKENDLPVLLLAQLNRGLLAREDKRPNMGDLRQSGDVEQDADNILFVHRPEEYLGKGEPERRTGEEAYKYEQRTNEWRNDVERTAGAAEIIIDKARDGEPGIVLLDFDKHTTSFKDRLNG